MTPANQGSKCPYKYLHPTVLQPTHCTTFSLLTTRLSVSSLLANRLVLSCELPDCCCSLDKYYCNVGLRLTNNCFFVLYSFDSTLAGIEFSDQGLVMAWRVPTDKVYGFGETEHHAFKHAFNWEKWGMFARDQPVVVSRELVCLSSYIFWQQLDCILFCECII